MLKAEKGMEFHLPPDCTKAVSVLGLSHRMGGFGEEFDWPVAKDSKGFSHQLNKLGDPKGNIAEKYYFKNRLNEGWIKIKYPSDNSTLTLNFPSEKVPYVGILVDEGWWKKDLLLIIPEPCTAAFDSINLSKIYSTGSVLKAFGKYCWYLEFVF